MHEMAVDVQQRRAVIFDVNDVFVPEFVVQRAGRHESGMRAGERRQRDVR
jgi:hypothetical protein